MGYAERPKRGREGRRREGGGLKCSQLKEFERRKMKHKTKTEQPKRTRTRIG